MKTQRNLLAVLAVLLLGMSSAMAQHHHYGGRVGIYVGPGWGPWYYPVPYSYYYQPQVVVVPAAQPQVYVEQNPQPVVSEPAQQVQPQQQYWYYCKSAKGYYPYVKECPDGWQKVSPEPPR